MSVWLIYLTLTSQERQGEILQHAEEEVIRERITGICCCDCAGYRQRFLRMKFGNLDPVDLLIVWRCSSRDHHLGALID